MTTALERLQGGYYNSDPVSEANPGGFADGGHVLNFPAALADLAEVAGNLNVDIEAIESAGENAAAAGAAASAAETARDEAQAIASGRTVRQGADAPSEELGRDGDWYIQRVSPAGPLLFGPKTDGSWGTSVAMLGSDAQEIELRVSGDHIQWRRGAGAWTDMIAVADLVGAPGSNGSEVSLQVSGGNVQWRLGEESWSNLIAVADLKGDAGGAGWSPVLAAEADGARRVFKVVDWVGGDDAKPATGKYVGPSGWVDTAGDATDIRAPAAAITDIEGLTAALAEKFDSTSLPPVSQADAEAGTGTAARTWTPQRTAQAVAALAGSSAAVAVQFGIALARLRGDQQGFQDGYADDFQDTDGVDLASSTAEDRVTSGTKGWRGRLSGSHPAAMTAGSAPSPYVATASSTYPGFDAWKAFDSSATYWSPSNGSANHTLTIDLGAPLTVATYTIQTPATLDGQLTGWTLHGSNDGSAWTLIDTRSGQTITSATTYTPATGGAFRYFQLRQTAVGSSGAYGSVSELRFATFTPAAMSLRSTAWAVATAPTRMSLAILASTATGAITAGTNLRGYVSRDGGTTWTEVTLAAKTDGAGVTTYEGAADVSTQPSGTSLKWRADTTTAGSADITVDAVVLQRK